MLKEKLEYFFKTGIECGICRLFERVVKRTHQAENTLNINILRWKNQI